MKKTFLIPGLIALARHLIWDSGQNLALIPSGMTADRGEPDLTGRTSSESDTSIQHSVDTPKTEVSMKKPKKEQPNSLEIKDSDGKHYIDAKGSDQPQIPAAASSPETLPDKDIDSIQTYVNNLRLSYGPYLKRSVSLQTKAVPYEKGVVLEFSYKPHEGNKDFIEKNIKPMDKAFKEVDLDISRFLTREQLEKYEQGKKNNDFIFAGTGVFCSDDKFFLIKDYDDDQWSEQAARKDAKRIVRIYNN